MSDKRKKNSNQDKDSKEFKARRVKVETSSRIALNAVYVPSGLKTPEHYLEHVGLPGEYPFTRGIHPTMYRGKLWTHRQYAGFGSAAEANQRYRYLLAQGTTGLSVAFDLPTQMGRDCDDPLSVGEVGRVGVSISSLDDMERLFDGIPLEKVSTSMTINATAAILLALYLVVAEKRGIPWAALRGTVQNDILKEYIARGTYIYPPPQSLRLVVDLIEFCRDRVPEWNTISISGYHIREAGSTAVQEIAFTLANGIAYVEAAIERGLEVDAFAPRLAFFFNCHNDFFEEIAKFRAARRLWAKVMKERFHARDPRSWMLRFHTQTAGSTLTAQQPKVNIVRTALQALAAVLGGTQSLHTNAYDEAVCLPTAASALLALRTQQVIAAESGVADVVDPLGGSFLVEELTDQLEARAAEYIAKIDQLGGMIRAIGHGLPQREIEEAAFAYQREIDRGAREIVGVNVYTDGDDQAELGQVPLAVDPMLESSQKQQLQERKIKRDQLRVAQALEGLKVAARSDSNLMPAICEAVRQYCTVGEISNVFREYFGQYQAVT